MGSMPRHFVEGEISAMQKTRKTALQVGLRELFLEGIAVDILHHEWRVWGKWRRSGGEEFYLVDESAKAR